MIIRDLRLGAFDVLIGINLLREGLDIPECALVAILDAEGRELPPGEPGIIAIRRPDPVMFLGYWNKPEATAGKFIGDWLLKTL